MRASPAKSNWRLAGHSATASGKLCETTRRVVSGWIRGFGFGFVLETEDVSERRPEGDLLEPEDSIRWKGLACENLNRSLRIVKPGLDSCDLLGLCMAAFHGIAGLEVQPRSRSLLPRNLRPRYRLSLPKVHASMSHRNPLNPTPGSRCRSPWMGWMRSRGWRAASGHVI